jgi:uncharacterized membrane protein YkvA (DUF1232 family)
MGEAYRYASWMPLWLVSLITVAAVWGAIVGVLIVAGRRSAARALAGFLPNLIALFRGLLRDPRVHRRSKVLLVLALLWLVSPIDLIPEFVPVAGPLDDAIVGILVLRHVVRRAGHEVVADHWRGDPATLDRILRIAGSRRAVA